MITAYQPRKAGGKLGGIVAKGFAVLTASWRIGIWA